MLTNFGSKTISQIRTVPSAEDEARYSPFGSKATQRIVSVWPLICARVGAENTKAGRCGWTRRPVYSAMLQRGGRVKGGRDLTDKRLHPTATAAVLRTGRSSLTDTNCEPTAETMVRRIAPSSAPTATSFPFGSKATERIADCIRVRMR
eukprot:scaffold232302_cov32-Tisochrysis_lutea.AAC.1